MTHEISVAFESEETVIGHYLVISRDFHGVRHEGLTQKMLSLNIPGKNTSFLVLSTKSYMLPN
jgi:hypothetical protein